MSPKQPDEFDFMRLEEHFNLVGNVYVGHDLNRLINGRTKIFEFFQEAAVAAQEGLTVIGLEDGPASMFFAKIGNRVYIGAATDFIRGGRPDIVAIAATVMP